MTFNNGERVSYKSPRGLVYGVVVYTYRNGERLRFLPDPGTTYAGGVLTSMDVRTADCERTALPPTAVTL